jgi:small subunit ribosomal protein S13
MVEQKQVIKERGEMLIRILGHDILGNENLYSGLTKIKGVSWGISNAICVDLGLDRRKKIFELDKITIKKIEDALKNRRKDFDSGEDKHLFGVDLDMRKDFDIKRLQKIKSYRGTRHSFKLPVRGQRTRSHFRRSGIAVGVKKPKTGKKS